MNQTVYISSANSQQIEVWKLNSNLSLNLIQILKTDGEPQSIIISNSKNCLYVGIRPKFHICSYKIDIDGTLIEIGKTNILHNINHFELDKNENYLFSSSYHFNCISVSPINSFGIPQPSIQTIYKINGCHASQMHDNNIYLFVSSLRGNRIYLYNFTDEGILLRNKKTFIPLENNSGPRHMLFQSSLNRLFSVNELNGTVSIWNIDKLCKNINLLKNINIIPNSKVNPAWSSDIHISPCEKYLYASDRNSNHIAIIKNSKNITDIKVIKYVLTEIQPRSFGIDQTGKCLISIGEKSNKMSIYSLDNTTGFLKFKNRYPTGNRPVWISIRSI
ncbi:MAG: 6-phosphogluconolactonase [Buchnera aphidicola (Nurudea yanoniella)]